MRNEWFDQPRRIAGSVSRSSVLAFVAIALSVLLAPMAGAHDGHPMKTTKPAASTASVERYEIKFMKDMIEHHRMALMMAEECQERATHEELKEMCHAMEADQAAEIRQMRLWLHAWYKVHVDSVMTHAQMKSMNGMASMKRLSRLSGSEYEIAFMKEMIKHHEMAIKRAAECTTRARHEELIEMCRAIETNQKREIEQMEEWLCKWYQQCR
jgi:uncharacterized protein (DUF305 family)